MANEEHLKILEQGVKSWNSWRESNPQIRPDLSYANLYERNFAGINMRGVCLYGASIARSDFSDSDFSPQVTYFDQEGSEEIKWNDDIPGEWSINSDFFTLVEEHKDPLLETVIPRKDGSFTAYADLRDIRAGGTNLTSSRITTAFLSDAVIAGANLSDASLINSVLLRTSFVNSELTNCKFVRARMVSANLARTHYDPEHKSLRDGSDQITFDKRDVVLNWARLRAIGTFPVFSVSWTLLVLSLFGVNAIGYLNSIGYFSSKFDIPDSLILTLVGSIFLAVGSTMYRIFCPQRVQEFTELKWVEENRRARLQYISESHRREWQLLTLVMIVVGGVIALFIAGENMISAVGYIMH